MREGALMALAIIGTPTFTTTGATITLPAHQVGDLIALFSWRTNITLPTKPVAGGTVPTWNDIENPSGNSTSCRSVYAVATATNHTSGSWTNAGRMIAVVLRGQAVSPIGGSASGTGSQANSATAPAVTLSDTSGNSVLLHFYGVFNTGGAGISAAPAGYTRQALSQTTSSAGICLNSKNSTTTDGAINQPHGNASAVSYTGISIEILTASVPQTGDASLAVTAAPTAGATRTHNAAASLAVTASPSGAVSFSAAGNTSLAVTAGATAAVTLGRPADASLAVTATPTSAAALAAVASAALVVTASPTGVASRGQNLVGDLAVTAAPSAQIDRTHSASASLAVTAGVSAAALNSKTVDSSLAVTAAATAAQRLDAAATTTLAATATPSAAVARLVSAAAALAVTVTPSAAAQRTANVAADLPVAVTPSAAGTRDARTTASLAVTAATTGAVQNTTSAAASLPGVAAFTATADVTRTISASLAVTVALTVVGKIPVRTDDSRVLRINPDPRLETVIDGGRETIIGSDHRELRVDKEPVLVGAAPRVLQFD